MNICLIHIYFGKLPVWFDAFIRTCQSNKNIEFLLFTDDFRSDYNARNIKHFEFSINDFEHLVRIKLKLTIKLQNAYKLCDFKPAFGKLFEDFIQAYEFWGYIDNDMLLGNLKKFISEDFLSKNDIISSEPDFMAGSFSLFRNVNKVNTMFTKIRDFQYLFQLPQHFAIDENLKSEHKLLNRISFKLKSIKFLFPTNKTYREKQFKYYWKVKKEMVDMNHPRDFTETIWAESVKGNIKAIFMDLMLSDRKMERSNLREINISWHKGNLKNNFDKKNICVFHFIDLKNFIVMNKELLFFNDDRIIFKK